MRSPRRSGKGDLHSLCPQDRSQKQGYLRKLQIFRTVKKMGLPGKTCPVRKTERTDDSVKFFQADLGKDCPADPALYHGKTGGNIIYLKMVSFPVQALFLPPLIETFLELPVGTPGDIRQLIQRALFVFFTEHKADRLF